MNFQTIVNGISSAACVVSVENCEDDNYGKIRIVCGNRGYIDTIEKPQGMTMKCNKFVPNTEYTDYVMRDYNFESACYDAAVQKKCVHSYAHTSKYQGVWFNMSFIPLESDDESLGYCIYIVEASLQPDAKRLSSISPEIATYVLETCIKLQNPDDFRTAMYEVCKDVLDLCGSEHCCILMMDTAKRKCSVLCEALSENTNLVSMEKYADDAFYDIAYSWLDLIEGSNCLIVKNDHDMEIIKERNPIWYHSITGAGGKNIVLFPLVFKEELLGFMWAINFSADRTEIIKETLELTSFILASELYSYKMVEHLRYMSYTDDLTKLPNRFASSERITDLIKREEEFAAVSINLNHFKGVNDAFGFRMGNEVLIEVAKRWKNIAVAKEGTTKDYITHINGDEFLLIISGYESEQELKNAILPYVNALGEPLTVDGCDLYLSASFGYAMYPDDANTDDLVVSHANLAMNEIKRGGNSDHILRYTPDLSKNERTIEIENIIRKALKNDTIYFHLQPQFDMEHNLRGFEALARMRDAEGNFVSPGDFIPVAEKVGLIDQLDSMVFKKATKFFGDLLKKTDKKLTLSLNASVRHLMKKGFVEEICGLIQQNGIAPDQLEIEITESIFMDSGDKSVQCISDLKDMGVKLAIDDFGTGYSSLSYLNRIPANLLKIDKSFIDTVHANESSKQYVAAMISIGHIMGLDVISEGVEDEEQLEALRSIGCNYIQGYIWGRPMPMEEIEKLVASI